MGVKQWSVGFILYTMRLLYRNLWEASHCLLYCCNYRPNTIIPSSSHTLYHVSSFGIRMILTLMLFMNFTYSSANCRLVSILSGMPRSGGLIAMPRRKMGLPFKQRLPFFDQRCGNLCVGLFDHWVIARCRKYQPVKYWIGWRP